MLQLKRENFDVARCAELATLEWVDWSNNRRLLSSIGDILPAEFEAMYYEAQESSPMAAGLN